MKRGASAEICPRNGRRNSDCCRRNQASEDTRTVVPSGMLVWRIGPCARSRELVEAGPFWAQGIEATNGCRTPFPLVWIGIYGRPCAQNALQPRLRSLCLAPAGDFGCGALGDNGFPTARHKFFAP